MSTFNPDSGLYETLPDEDLDRRAAFLQQLGLAVEADPVMDGIARELGEASRQPWAMVNFITGEQHFVGLYVAPGAPPVARSMVREHGYCPDLLDRPVALVLPDVCMSSRFQSNEVVDSLGVRTYSGAPLIHHQSGLTLGTVCFIGPEAMPESTGSTNCVLVKAARDQVMDVIHAREANR